MDVVVQPSVPWMSLNDQIKDSGLFFPVDPGPSVSCHDSLLRYAQTGIPRFANFQRLGLVAWSERVAGTSVATITLILKLRS
jgi:FAD/FMN-containing dehydrogenase